MAQRFDEKNEGEIKELEELEIDLLLEGIYRYYGYDFRNYTRPFIRRRIWHRINAEKLNGVLALQEKVLYQPSTMNKLFSDFSIHVTEMFRDPTFFKTFIRKIVPLLKDYPVIRIWHAGCSTGEEVYSMAILLYEEGLYDKTRIYATDLNENFLQIAKQGLLSIDRMKLYTKNYIEAGGTRSFSEYYTCREKKVTFDSFLAKNIVFAQHNLATDESFNEFHLIICRNVMIYFNKTLQNRVHQLFYESLSPNGFLGLGKKEHIQFTIHNKCYEEIDKDERLYRKKR